jgi:hypothetical protein
VQQEGLSRSCPTQTSPDRKESSVLDRQDSDCVLEAEREREDEKETVEQDACDSFSPRIHQEGFWS